MTKVLAVIPARGNSKGIPNKNLQPLGGKPLLAYAIEPALSTGLVDRVIVSSDSEEILSVARELGAETPFVRPAELAGDRVPDRPVFQHALQWLAEQEDYRPDFVLNLRCTAPFKTPEDIEKVIETWEKTGADSVRTMTRVEGVFHPYWMYRRAESGLALPFDERIDPGKYFQRQLLPPAFRLNGVVDGIRSEIILNHSQFYGDNMAMVEIPENRAVDIDTPADLEYAEFLLSKNLIG